MSVILNKKKYINYLNSLITKLNYINFYKKLNNFTNIEKIRKIAVSLSGGMDSICLTFILHNICQKNNILLIAIIINHNFKKKTIKDSKDLLKYLKRYSINCSLLTWHHDKISSNIQKKARNARYRMLHYFCNANNIQYLFIGHTYNDQAETVLLRMLRGSGVDGIGGVNIFTKINDIKIIRPLLIFLKFQIINFLIKERLLWFEDISNSNVKFKRIQIRNLINCIDVNLEFTEKINSLSFNIQRIKQFIKLYTIKLFTKYCKMHTLGYLSMNKVNFSNLNEEIKLRLIKYIIRYIRNDVLISPIKLQNLDVILNNLESSNKKNITLCKCKIFLFGIYMYIYKEYNYIEPKKLLLKGENLWDKRYKIHVNIDDFKIFKITKRLWYKIKPKNYNSNIFQNVIFSTPVCFLKKKNIYILPLQNIVVGLTKNILINVKIKITHIPSNTFFKINL